MRLLQVCVFASLLVCPAEADTLIVCNKTESTLSFVDLETGKEIVRRETSRSPHEIALSPDGRKAVVVSYIEKNYVGEELDVFDTETATLIKKISISPHMAPHGIEWIGDSSDVLVTTEKSHDVIKVDVKTGRVIGSVETGTGGPHLMALAPDNQRAYVTDRDSNSVFVIDISSMSLAHTLKADKAPEGIAVSPDGSFLWVGNNESQTIVVFDISTMSRVAVIDAGYVPIRIRFLPNGTGVAVADLDGGRVIVYDPLNRQKISAVDLSTAGASSPASLLFSPDGKQLYVGAQKSGQVVEIETNTWKIARVFSVGKGADSMAITSVNASH